MRFLQSNEHLRNFIMGRQDFNQTNNQEQKKIFSKDEMQHTKDFNDHRILKNLQQQNLISNSNSQIPIFTKILLKHFQQIKTQLNHSIDQLIKVLVDNIFNENQVLKKIFYEIEQKDRLSIQQLSKINEAVQILKQQFERFQQIFNKNQQEILLKDLSPILINGQKQTKNYYNFKNEVKLQHAVSHPPKLFCPPNQNDYNLKSQIRYEYKLLNEEQQTQNNQEYKIYITQLTKNPEQQNLYQKFQQKRKVLTLDQYRNQKTKSSLDFQSKKSFNFQFLKIANKNKRKLSINLQSSDKSFEKSYQNCSFSSKNDRLESQMSEQPQKAFSIEIKSPMQKLQQLYRQDVKKINLKNHKLSFEVKQQHQSFQDFSGNKNIQKSSNQLRKQLDLKDSIFNMEKNDKSLLKNIEIRPQRFRRFSHYEDKNQNNQSLRQKNYHFWGTKKFTQKSQLNKKFVDNDTKGCYASNNPILTLNQLKSAAIYLKSLNLTAKEKIQKLKKSLTYDPKNLSAGQSLSYLYLKTQSFKECLQLCNIFLGYFSDEDDNINEKHHRDLIHIICNKTTALNLLGRYSQTIKFIQNLQLKTEKHFQLEKNLADAYSSLGKYDTATIHYKKCLQIENKNCEVMYNLSVCHFMTDSFFDAIESILQALKINSNQPQYIELYQQIKSRLR